MFQAQFMFGNQHPPMGASTANESASSVDFLMSGLFGVQTPAFIQYRQNQQMSGAQGPLPQGLNPDTTPAAGPNYLVFGLILLAFFIMK